MKKLLFLLLFLTTYLNVYSQEKINGILDSLNISISTISFHPEGDILISTGLNQKDMSQYLLVITKSEGTIQIDTLASQRPNRSAFSQDGEYLIHNYLDEVSDEFYTVKRKYDNPNNIGAPFYLSESLFTDNMYYYFMDAHQNFYYYTFVRENRSEGGLLLSKFENGKYQKPEILFPDRENAVAYSPLLLDDKTMVFAQHGIIDDTFRGIHYSLKDDSGEWSEPKLLSEIPMSNVITYYDKETVAFLVAKNNRIQFYDKANLLSIIQKREN